MNESQTIELHITQHPGRRGWEVVKIAYDAHNRADAQAIDAALLTLRAARHERADLRKKEAVLAS